MTAPQRSPEWFAQRQGKVTASAAGAILGLSPFMSREGVMRALVREALGAPSEFPDPVPPPVAWGNAMEAGAITDFEMDTGMVTKPAPFVEYEGWLGGSPDAFIGDDAGLEQKCPWGIRNDPKPKFKTLEEQPHYAAQVQICLFVTKRKRWFFNQWTPYATNLEEVEPDQAWLDENLPKLKQFHAELVDTIADPALHQEHLAPLRTIIDTPAAAMMVREYDELSEAIERATERKKDLLAEMVTLAGERDAAFGGRKLTLTKRAGSVSYAKAIRELAPDADLSKWTGKPSSFWGLK